MDAPDSRTRKKITLIPKTVLSASVSGRLLSGVIIPNLVLVTALWTTREWLLSEGVAKSWVMMRMLACSGLGLTLREYWTGNMGKALASFTRNELVSVGLLGIAMLVQVGGLLVALANMSATRVAVFVHFSTACGRAMSNSSSLPRPLPVFFGLAISFASDAGFSLNNVRDTLPAYFAFAVYALSTCAVEHYHAQSSSKLGARYAATFGTFAACVVALCFYSTRKLTLNPASSPVVSIVSLLALPLLAYATQPSSKASEASANVWSQIYGISAVTICSTSAFIGAMWFSQWPSWAEGAMAILVLLGGRPARPKTRDGVPETPILFTLRSHLKTIMDNPDSRKIFYFLILNITFMVVQMLYGVWTNSLGLISDAIHMGFDCLAIGVGLFASIMATWPPNERFTYGYGRIETLSGFANGIFLVLISIFIIFEAIQRLLEPPEMNTNQLLLISSLGLGVNLFGMFAMGGHAHHHHGHSHSHGHDHGHSHGHDHGHSHGHDHSHDHGHGHDHGHSHEHDHDHDHSHCNGHDHDHDHDHDHGHEHEHNHEHGHNHDHGHEHEGSNGHLHPSHHAHSHSPLHTHPTHSHSHAHLPSHSHSSSPTNGSAPPLPKGRHARSRSAYPADLSSSHDGEDHHHSHDAPQARNANGLSVKVTDPSRFDLHKQSLQTFVFSPKTPRTPADLEGIMSPVTPSYRFGVDEHFATHHQQHTPNLHDHSHVHDHHHDHHGHSDNMRGVFLHVMADTLGSVGVIISTLLIQFYGWTGFDPIASLFIAVLIAASVVPLIIDTGKVLALDLSEHSDGVASALSELSSVTGLVSYSSPQFWPKDASSLIGSVHIQLKNTTPVDAVVERVDSLLRSRIPGLEELMIQAEDVDLVER
ncbi:hypothetical protein OF83DRAFT_1101614 [Amylostereum chailletii]|nr:hypothetical protein OF83DRAFT_1101614 [Amylostereum chailletii]